MVVVILFCGEPPSLPETMPDVTLTIDGMHCDGCENRVETGLTRLEGVRSAEADHEAGTAEVTLVAGREDTDALEETVDELGYEVVGLEKG